MDKGTWKLGNEMGGRADPSAEAESWCEELVGRITGVPYKIFVTINDECRDGRSEKTHVPVTCSLHHPI